MNNLIIFTDGAYSSTRDQGGIGIVFVSKGEKIKTYSRMFKHVTNNKMELTAVIIALKTLIKNNIKNAIIYTDSQYVIGCAAKGWKRKKNISLWNRYDKIINILQEKNIKIEFKWVHGHDGNEFNELADKLAVSASQDMDL